MSILAWIEDQRKLKLLNAPKYNNPASDGSQGLWTRCDHCGVILYIKHLKENQRVCFGCGYHLQMNSQERIEHIIDSGSWRPLDETLSPCDPLEFRDQKYYTERLKEAQERTGLQDAIQTGTGMLDGIPIALGVMDFNFMGGSMGSVVGEKITRLIEYATQEGLTLILVCASGGARMQEGILSLMQMAKISAALQVYQSCANLLYISVLTSPTTGGVTASFAMLGDLIFAEPKALIGFAGRRVIEQTLQEQLPDDFQTAEYLLHHGLLDLIVPRSFLKQALSETITLYKDAPFKESGIIPHGIQQNLGFLSEEKVRRKLKNWSSNFQPYPLGRELYSSQNLEKNKNDKLESKEISGIGWNPIPEDSLEIISPTKLSETAPERLIENIKYLELQKDSPRSGNPLELRREVETNKKIYLGEDNLKQTANTKNLLTSLYLSYKNSPSDSYYREILLSFETIFNFFENKSSFTTSNILGNNSKDYSFFSKNEKIATPLEPLAVSHIVREAQEQKEQLSSSQIHDKKEQPSFINKSFKESEVLSQQQQSFTSTTSFVFSSQKLIQNSIFRANHEVIEWRALYYNQNVQPKITFLEYLTNPLGRELYSSQNEQKDIDKKFFYKKISNKFKLKK